MTSRQGSLDLLADPVAQRLLASSAPARLAYEWVLIECDEAAAVLFDDQSAASHAQMLRRRGAAVRYASARRHRQLLRDTEATLERHRARFLARHRKHATDND